MIWSKGANENFGASKEGKNPDNSSHLGLEMVAQGIRNSLLKEHGRKLTFLQNFHIVASTLAFRITANSFESLLF